MPYFFSPVTIPLVVGVSLLRQMDVGSLTCTTHFGREPLTFGTVVAWLALAAVCGVVGAVGSTGAVPARGAVAGGGGVGLAGTVLARGAVQAVHGAGAALAGIVGALCAAPLRAVLCAVSAVVACRGGKNRSASILLFLFIIFFRSARILTKLY